MATMQNQYSQRPTVPEPAVRRADSVDWAQEITAPRPSFPAAPADQTGQTAPTTLDIKHHLPQEVIEAPTTAGEALAGSWKSVLARNLGNYVVATFLIGTQGTTTWEGVLYDVGNDYLVVYQAGRDRYIVCDLYSLKYIEFYDTSRREMCEELMRQNGWNGNG